ncbi:MAG: BtpA/SgcQ family protein [Gemmatimonadota bacterium]
MTPESAPRRNVPATRDDLARLFGTSHPLIGMVHLPPLPGSPLWGRSLDAVLERVRADARCLVEGGMDGLLLENFGDQPFRPYEVEPVTVAVMTRAVMAAREVSAGLPLGVNVLRNDATAALGIAAATGAAFIRVNVHTGTMFTDQGMLEGRAHETLRLRERIAPGTLVLADLLVKHATPPPGLDPVSAARDLRHRGLADVLVVPGAATGVPVDPARIRGAREAVPDAPVWVGSGITPANVRELLRLADGAIVGSSLHEDGKAGTGIDPARVSELVSAFRE